MNQLTTYLQTRKYIMWFVLAIIVIAVVYFMGRKSGSVKIENVPLPSDKGLDSNKLTDDEGKQVRKITLALYQDMSGINVFSRDIQAFRELNTLSDTLFVAVYNDFNTMYGSEGESLREWIQGEKSWSFNPLTMISSDSSFSELKTNIIQRMNRLNLI